MEQETPNKTAKQTLPVTSLNDLSIEEEALLLRQCRLNKVQLVRELLESKRISNRFKFSNGETLLITACKSASLDVIRFLLDHGVDVHEEDNYHNNALHWSVRLGFDKIADLLISHDEIQRPNRSSQNKVNKPAYKAKLKHPQVDGKEDAKKANRLGTQTHGPSPSDPVVLPSLGRPRLFLESVSRPHDPHVKSTEERKKKLVKETPYQRMYLQSVYKRPPKRQKLFDKYREPRSHRELKSKAQDQEVREDEQGDHETRAKSEPLVSEASDTPPEQKKGPKKQRILDLSQEDPEPETGLIHLRNFDADGNYKRINSPRSIEAMKRLGITMEELMPMEQKLSFSESKDAEVLQKKKEMLEERRKRNVDSCIKERKRLKARSKDATLNVIFAEYAGISGDNTMNMSEYLDMMKSMELLQSETERKHGKISKTEAVGIFKQFARKIGVTYEVTWEQFVKLEKHLSGVLGIKSISKAGEHQETEDSETSRKDAVEADPAAVYIQEVRAKHERVNRTELRRIETYFEKLLSLKAQHDTLEQASHQKESKIIKNYEDRKYTSALNRLDQQFKYVERVLQHQKMMAKKKEEEEERSRKKQEEAKMNLQKMTHERERRMRMQTEQLKIRQQLRQEQITQRDRKEEYRRKLLMDKLTREQLKQEKDREIKKLIAQETDKLKSKSRMEKEKFNEVVQNFMKSGKIDVPKGLSTLGDLDTILVREDAADWEDKNEAAGLLSEDASVSGEIKSGEYAYFKIRVETHKSWTFAVSSTVNKALLFIGNKNIPFPTKENHTWNASNKDKVTIFHLDKRYTLGYWYVSLLAQGGDSTFSLSCSSVEPLEGEARDDSKRQESLSHVHNRVRVKINEMREKRLSQMDSDFISKFEELFPQT